jgi:hypothetical protein
VKAKDLRAKILAADDRPREPIKVPEWGVDAFVATMSGTDRDAFDADMFNRKDAKERAINFRARLVARCLVDEDGERVFAEADIEALGKRSAAALDRVYEVAAKLNRLTETEAAEAEKNSAADRSGSSSTG